MYPDTFLGWFVGMIIVFAVTIGVTMFAYFMGHKVEEWLNRRDERRKDDDAE